ncbi:peptidylprolyl isomerase [Thermoplasmatota archaeon]
MVAKTKNVNRKRSRPVEPKNSFLNFKIIGIIAIIAIIIISVYFIFISFDSNDSDNNDQNPIAIIDTNKGIIQLELFEDKVPNTCENFIKLANDGFYDGMNFYRISDNFMIQAGRFFPDGSESQSPYENIEFEIHEDVKHVDGAISMASTGAGVGGSAEFFICDGEQSFLDGNYAPFGVVSEGFDVLRDIADDPHDNSNPAGGGRPLEDIIINSITIEYQ